MFLPEVSVGNTQTVIERLKSYDADIGVLGDVPQNRIYEVIQLSSTPIVAFAAREGAMGKRRSISMLELSKLPLVMREQGSKTRAKFEEFAEQLGFKSRVGIEAEGREAVREIVAFGDDVGIVSAAEFGDDDRFIKIPITDAKLTMDEALVCLKDRHESRLIRPFMDIARLMTSVGT